MNPGEADPPSCAGQTIAHDAAGARCNAGFHAKAWYKVIYDLGIGALVSLAFYVLVVRLPEYQQRQRLKRSLEMHYRAFRLNCIEIMLAVAAGRFAGGQAEALLDPEEFKKYFKQEIAPGTERWDEFMKRRAKAGLVAYGNTDERVFV